MSPLFDLIRPSYLFTNTSTTYLRNDTVEDTSFANSLLQQQEAAEASLFHGSRGPAPARRKSHKHDDQAALQELKAQREARIKEPRLPTWAKEAVASQGRTAPSTSTSPAPSAAPVRRAKNPFL